jgi:tetratricopeptide (TPR) repeat protein
VPAARPEVAPPAPSKGRDGPTKPLTKAIHALRIERDATSALALLERHRGEFAQQGLAHEALILRVEALLELGRDREALHLLDGAALSDVDASHSLLVTRGRLRAAANRCVDGVGDFNLVLAESRRTERQSLFGRALCRKQLGDSAGAAADLERYRREFPTDPQLVELERWLSGAK